MANSRMVVLGLAILLVCFCFIKVTNAGGDDKGSSSIHTFQRDPHEGCKAKHSGEECPEDDDDDDVDDSFRGPIRVSLKLSADEAPIEANEDDPSPDATHNNVVVLGH